MEFGEHTWKKISNKVDSMSIFNVALYKASKRAHCTDKVK